MMSGAWKYPPRKDRKAQQRREALVFALWFAGFSIFALLIGSWATKVISQAAYDAVHFQPCIHTGC
jgi:hypothetical protein